MRPRFSFSSHRTRNIENIRKQRQKYPDIAKKIVEDTDIILEILDARFPEETRNKEIEESIKKKGKKLIFVLNKSDLTKDRNISKEIFPYIFISSTQRKGISELRKKIQIEAKRVSGNEKVKVGIIGYPNTGKSSLINVLVGKSSAGVGSDAGFTKGFQKIKLSSNIVLVDTPGVIPSGDYSQTKNELITHNTKIGGKSYSQVREPENVVGLIMNEYKELLEKFYNIKADNDVDLFLEELGKKKGLMKKGGEPNTDAAARLVLKDWQKGNIRV